MIKTSAVIVARNDNYGEHLPERALHCLNQIANVFDEVIYTDWASPWGISLLDLIYRDLQHHRNIKQIKISPNLALRLLNGRQSQRCCEVLGRNIGIRRAKGDWIVSTNIDIVPIIDNDFYEKLDKNSMSIGRRKNVDMAFWLGHSSNLKEALIENRCLFPKVSNDALCDKDVFSLVYCCGDFQIAHKSLWHKIRGFEEDMTCRMFSDSNVQMKAKMAGFNLTVLEDLNIFHLNHIPGYGGGCDIPKNNMTRALEVSTTINHPEWGFYGDGAIKISNFPLSRWLLFYVFVYRVIKKLNFKKFIRAIFKKFNF